MLTPKDIVESLNKYIIGQDNAKRAVAIALRNRYRRSMLSDEMREEVYPKNIIMMGPTGVGKTEIARRLAKLVDAPFVKVEATKFTEVGYVGRDVDSMIRDLIDVSVHMTHDIKERDVRPAATEAAEKRVVELLMGDDDVVSDKAKKSAKDSSSNVLNDLVESFLPAFLRGNKDEDTDNDDTTNVIELPPADNDGGVITDTESKQGEVDNDGECDGKQDECSYETMLSDLRAGRFDDLYVEITVSENQNQVNDAFVAMGVDLNLGDMFEGIIPKRSKKRRMKICDVLKVFVEEEADKLIDMDEVISEAITRAEQEGIIFIDEIDKIAEQGHSSSGPDVSREGVQRDILPIVEGCSVNTKYGMVKTDHILFIAAGAFHMSKVSDLIPELQGRFPIRVELNALTKGDFIRILTQPQNAVIKQYKALMNVDNIIIDFTEDAIDRIAELARDFNETHENIGARRLQTILENLLDEISFETGNADGTPTYVTIDAKYVNDHISEDIAVDLRRYIL